MAADVIFAALATILFIVIIQFLKNIHFNKYDSCQFIFEKDSNLSNGAPVQNGGGAPEIKTEDKIKHDTSPEVIHSRASNRLSSLSEVVHPHRKSKVKAGNIKLRTYSNGTRRQMKSLVNSFNGRKRTNSETKASQTDITTSEDSSFEQSNFDTDSQNLGQDELKEVYESFVSMADGELPDWIYRTKLCPSRNTVYVYINSSESRRSFDDFLRSIGFKENHNVFTIQISEPPNLLGKQNQTSYADNEGISIAIVKRDVRPGSPLTCIPSAIWNTEKRPKSIDELHDPTNRDMCIKNGLEPKIWTLGFPVVDEEKKKIYLATCCHVFKNNEHEKEDLSLSFVAAFEENEETSEASANKIVKRLREICSSDYIGFHGGYKMRDESGFRKIIDFMLLPFDEQTGSRVDLGFKVNDEILTMDIYQGTIASLLQGNNRFKVYVLGCMSGYREGYIIDADIGEVNINKSLCTGAFAVQLDEKLVSGGNHLPRVAQPGDSGGLVYGQNSSSGKYMAIGLVWAGNQITYEKESTRETFEFVTFCTPLAFAKGYVMKEHGINIAFYAPDHPTSEESNQNENQIENLDSAMKQLI